MSESTLARKIRQVTADGAHEPPIPMLQYVATHRAPFGPVLRPFWVEIGQRVPGDHPAVLKFPEKFRPATGKDLKNTVHVGFLQKEDS